MTKVPKFRRARIRQLVRQFKENGLKMMLEHPANVRDLLNLVDTPWLGEIDFSRLQQIKTTFIRRDYRHLESDIVLTAPLGPPGRSRKKLLIYILIEHQSEPDRLMPLRLADTQVQIFRYQMRRWSQADRSLARLRFSPVLPVVFYTGERHWEQVGTLADLIERGEEFRALTPIVERPLYLNLPDLSAAKLQRGGGYFGWVLQTAFPPPLRLSTLDSSAKQERGFEEGRNMSGRNIQSTEFRRGMRRNLRQQSRSRPFFPAFFPIRYSCHSSSSVLPCSLPLAYAALLTPPSEARPLGGWDAPISSSVENFMHVPAYAVLAWLGCSALLRARRSLRRWCQV